MAGTRGGTFAWAGGDELVFVDGDGGLRVADRHGNVRAGPNPRGRAAAPAVSARGEVAYVDETADECVISVAPLDADGAPRVVSHADFAWDPAWSDDGVHLAWHEWDGSRMPWDGSRIVVASVGSWETRIVAGGKDEAVGQPRFRPGGTPALAFVSDRSGWMNVWITEPSGAPDRPVRLECHEQAEPAWGPGQRSYAWSPGGQSIAFCRNEDGFGRLVAASIDRPGPAAEIRKGWHRHIDWGSAGIVALRSGARTRPAVSVVDGSGAQRRVIAAPRPARADADGVGDGVELVEAVEPEIVRWTGEDGTTISGLRYCAASAAGSAGAPLLVMVHSGPNSQAIVDWDERVQHFAIRGWTVLAPNYRGSAGYGRAFTQALTGRWGEVDVSDTVRGIRAAVASGWADPARIAVVGGSAGGFTALLCAVTAPDLVGAVVASYPVTDLLALAARTHRFEAHALDRHVGRLPGAEAEYRTRSPIRRVTELRAPVLVLQGDTDPVVSVHDTDAFVDALRAHNSDVEYHVYPGVGHGWSQPGVAVDARARADRFLTTRVLGT